jgi:UPF0271 protein
MAGAINLNADIAESYGAWQIGDDATLIRQIASANVACGFHGGDWNTMYRFCRLARDLGVSIGAHPGFNDLWGFGRRQIKMEPDDIERMVAYQIGALQAIARYADLPVTHLKAHGALANMAAVDRNYALPIARAVKVVDPSLIYVAQVGTELERTAQELGLRIAREGFADRQYEDDLTLVPRSRPGSVFRDPETAAAQALRMVKDGVVVTRSGKLVPIAVDTVCIHGDEPTGVAVATAVRKALEGAGVRIVTLPAILSER